MCCITMKKQHIQLTSWLEKKMNSKYAAVNPANESQVSSVE